MHEQARHFHPFTAAAAADRHSDAAHFNASPTGDLHEEGTGKENRGRDLMLLDEGQDGRSQRWIKIKLFPSPFLPLFFQPFVGWQQAFLTD